MHNILFGSKKLTNGMRLNVCKVGTDLVKLAADNGLAWKLSEALFSLENLLYVKFD